MTKIEAVRPRILLVEDEPSLALALRDRLRAERFDVDHVEDGEAALELVRRRPPDLVVLDVMLPGIDGFEVCRRLRSRGAQVPILMLTARGEVTDRVVGLRLGADDYLVKPFETAELLARIEARLRRTPPRTAAPESGVVRFGAVVADFRKAEVLRADQPVQLSALELRLLEFLVTHPDEVHSRDRLLDEVWGYEATPVTRTVDVHVAGLRRKLEENPSHPRHLLTVHGLGYRFVVEPASESIDR